MQINEIKSIIRNALGNRLGTYTTPKNRVYPAIRISPPEVPAEWRVDGLEVIIFKATEQIGQTQPLTGDQLLEYRNWIVFLTQFDRNRSVQDDVNILLPCFPVMRYRIQRQTATDYEQARLAIFDPHFFDATGELSPAFDFYNYTIAYSSIASGFTVIFDDLTNQPNRGFVTTGTNQWLSTDLGQLYYINQVVVEAGYLDGYGYTADKLNGARIEVSTNNTTWAHVATIENVTDTSGRVFLNYHKQHTRDMCGLFSRETV